MENPKLALIPSGYKSGKVYSILPVDGVGDLDFDRGSESSRVNKNGLIETVGNNEPKLDWLNNDCPSLLLEPQRTNLYIDSQDIASRSWNKNNFYPVTSNQEVAPDGTLTADELFEYPSTASRYIYQTLPLTSETNYYSVSFFVKYQNKQYIQLTGSDGFEIFTVNYDILNGEIVRNLDNADAQIEDYGGGWYRISLTIESTSGTSGRILLAGITSATSPRLESYTGNSSNSYYIWGGQAEQFSGYPTSYIRTESSTVTRAKDIISPVNLDFNPIRGTFFLDIKSFGAGPNYISLEGGFYDRIRFNFKNNNIVDITIGNAPAPDYFTYTYNHNRERFRVAIIWNDGNYSLFINGIILSNQTIGQSNGFLDSLNYAGIFGGFEFEGKVHDTKVFDRALTEEEAKKLTTI